MEFTKGIKDGLPIALGYVPVAFAYAVGAVDRGFPLWFPILISASNFTGTGQFAGTNLIAAGAESFLELGPGATLAGLGKRIAPDHAFLNAEDMSGIEAAAQALL